MVFLLVAGAVQTLWDTVQETAVEVLQMDHLLTVQPQFHTQHEPRLCCCSLAVVRTKHQLGTVPSETLFLGR
jgi:hypothetical protein